MLRRGPIFAPRFSSSAELSRPVTARLDHFFNTRSVRCSILAGRLATLGETFCVDRMSAIRI